MPDRNADSVLQRLRLCVLLFKLVPQFVFSGEPLGLVLTRSSRAEAGNPQMETPTEGTW